MELRDRIAVAMAKAQDNDYWIDDIAQWECAEAWERKAYPHLVPGMAYEDRYRYRKVADAVIEELGLTEERDISNPFPGGPPARRWVTRWFEEED